ncbi:hypothetical protein DF3PA_60086 [Candidatus Defluviicoccus seviourii]|uniref:Uncharacterized protein n=1 Tax=Candidatus Defluviicoccus seviourii TaxID=2565273 RepID=A0A564WGL3_9PROT|nr:hypothetical protein DF3PA_60086 [Candidatus Defluviicoccus seviourii]
MTKAAAERQRAARGNRAILSDPAGRSRISKQTACRKRCSLLFLAQRLPDVVVVPAGVTPHRQITGIARRRRRVPRIVALVT